MSSHPALVEADIAADPLLTEGDSKLINHMRAIDHVAVAVRDADAAIRYYTEQIGLELVGDEIAEDPGVRLVYLQAGKGRLQLVSPFRPGPVADWLDANGDGLHHVCFEVGDIATTLGHLPGQAEQPIFRGGRSRRACFLRETPDGVLIELTETNPS